MSFVHLHVHTQFSLLDGAARIDDLVTKAKAEGMTALAITDHGVMYGVVDFYKACKKAGIKPILGMEAYVAPRSLEDREGRQDREYAHLILLCKNEEGYHNLMRLSSAAFLKGFYYKPRIDYDLLEQYAGGLICLSACLAGDIPQRLLQGDPAGAEAIARRLQSMFGEDFYIELQDHGLEEQQQVLPGLKAIAKNLGLSLVATNDVHYVSKEDAEAQDVLLCIQTNRFVDETDRMRMQTPAFYLKNEAEMRALFPDCLEAIENTRRVADKCDCSIDFAGKHLPGFTAPDGMENATYLTRLCEEGLVRKMPGADQKARDRLAYELSVILSMGFVDYFLIVWDFIHFAKTHDIIVGPGRGSGAGSLAAYCLDITDVDPIKYGLLFERFLNPERISMPDFDVDFCYERRQEVIDYVVAKYGADHVAQIITFGTMAARAVVRDVGRALRIPYGEMDKLAKMIPFELNMTLERALSLSPELRSLNEQDPSVHKVLALGRKLEGLPRHASTHAAGVVISKLPITEVVPLQKNDESVTTQFPMGTLEELGLLKMDFLGLRTLTVIRDTLAFIRLGGKPVPDINRMDFDDPKVYAMIARGETDGVFQLESAGMRQFLMQLGPDSFEDIIAGISLFRPGPMAQIPRYVAAKHGTAVRYQHALLEPILSGTYGCMVYQEQVMQIVRDLGGFSLGRSDLVRRAMSKKKHDVMAKERQNFIFGNEAEGICGAIKNGVPEDVANAIFDEMMDFASYAFNKSHAACYAVVAYRTGYLKLYYKVEFMAALLNSYLGNADKVAEYVYIARRLGVAVLPPDVNRSFARFSVEGNSIRFGLSAVRNVGAAAMEAMVREREQKGPFRDFFDFVDRVEGLNKRMIEGLIHAGCFDATGAKRSQLIAVYERAMDGSAQARRAREAGQISLFDLGDTAFSMVAAVSIALPNLAELASKELLEREREAIGIYISGHPLEEYGDALAKMPYTVTEIMETDGETPPLTDNAKVRVGGLVRSMKQKPVKSGNGMMGYATLEGVTGTVELVLFPRTLQAFSGVMLPASAVAVCGKLSIREGQPNSILVEEAIPLAQAAGQKTLYLRFQSLTTEGMATTSAVLSRYPGNVPVILYDSATGRKQLAPKQLFTNASAPLLGELKAFLGEDNVKIAIK